MMPNSLPFNVSVVAVQSCQIEFIIYFLITSQCELHGLRRMIMNDEFGRTSFEVMAYLRYICLMKQENSVQSQDIL